MSRKAATSRRSSMKMLLPVVALVLVSAVMWAGPAAAHTFTRNDGNDSPGRLDLLSVSVSHTATSVVHKVRTFESWTPRSLGSRSFFIIQIDKNNTAEGVYERCAFIFYTNRLRGSLTNCGSQFIRYLPVAKLSGTVASITIPKSQTGDAYWWAGASSWNGPGPCRGGCVDFAPNDFPDMLHDIIPPVVNLEPTPLRVWEDSTTANFTFPFSVFDAHTGIRSWIVQRRELGLPSWRFVTSGASGGPKTPPVVGDEDTRFDARVLAVDNHGNQRIRSVACTSPPTTTMKLSRPASRSLRRPLMMSPPRSVTRTRRCPRGRSPTTGHRGPIASSSSSDPARGRGTSR